MSALNGKNNMSSIEQLQDYLKSLEVKQFNTLLYYMREDAVLNYTNTRRDKSHTKSKFQNMEERTTVSLQEMWSCTTTLKENAQQKTLHVTADKEEDTMLQNFDKKRWQL